MVIAITLGDAVVNQNEVFMDIVITVEKAVCAVLFFHGVAKHLNIAGALIRFPHVFLQNHCARRTTIVFQEPTFCEHFVD